MAGKIVKGVLVLSLKSVSAKEYSFENKSDHDKTVVIEHPLRAGWNLVDTPKPVGNDQRALPVRAGCRRGQNGASSPCKEENRPEVRRSACCR